MARKELYRTRTVWFDDQGRTAFRYDGIRHAEPLCFFRGRNRMKHEYKVGDKVRMLEDYGELVEGEVYRVEIVGRGDENLPIQVGEHGDSLAARDGVVGVWRRR